MPQKKSKTQDDFIPKDSELYQLTDFFKVFGDPTRVRILFHLFNAEISVGQLATDLCLSSSAVSHQLQVLKSGGLVRKRRSGKRIIYTIADSHVRAIIAQGREHIAER